MECREIIALLDSYLCDELATETNVAIIRHTETCAGCRRELTARRQLRELLQQTAKATPPPPDLQSRLRQRLRAENIAAAPATLSSEKKSSWFSQWFTLPMLPRFAAAAVLLFLFVGGFYFWSQSRVQAATLHPQFWQQVHGDHDYCSAQWLRVQQTPDVIFGIETIDSELKNLPQIAAANNPELTFHHAHVCAQDGRQFAHLVYSRNKEVISFFVTPRNAQALLSGAAPNDDGSVTGLQKNITADGKFQASAVQTKKYIVVIASSLPLALHEKMLEPWALAVGKQLRQAGQ